MENCYRILGLIVLFYIITCASSPAKIVVGKRLVNNFYEGTLSVATSNNGIVAILLEGGKVKIFNNYGAKLGELNVNEESSDIALSSEGDRLYAVNSVGEFEILAIDYVSDLRTEDIPYSKGEEDAPVTIVVFSDYQCPHCARLYGTIGIVMEKYKKQVRLINKFFPLISANQFSMEACKAAMAAEKQGKFWEYHDAIFKDGEKFSLKTLEKTAMQLSLDMDKFNRDRNDPRFVNYIRNDINEGKKNHVASVPAVFINGRRLQGLTVEGFSEIINQERDKK